MDLRTRAEAARRKAERHYREETLHITAQFRRLVAAGPHRILLLRVKPFFQWATEQGWLDANPLAAIKPVGQVRTGKTQLRIYESRSFLATAQKLAQDGDLGASGCLMMLLLDLPCSEVLARVGARPG